jgi:hypothetical protein
MNANALLISVILPLVISSLTTLLAITICKRASPTNRYATPVIALGWWLATATWLIAWRLGEGDGTSIADWLRDIASWDFWQWAAATSFAAAFLLGSSAAGFRRTAAIRWVIAAILAMAIAAFSLPVGDSWQDALPAHRGWLPLLATAILLGWFAADSLAFRRTDRWFPLVILATLAGPLIATATTYATLAQYAVAAISATLPIVAFAALGRLPAQVAIGAAYPAIALAASLIAAGKFYSYEGHPWWSYVLMMAIPPVVAAADWPLRNRNPSVRFIAAAVVATALVAGAATFQLLPSSNPAAGSWE